MDTKAQLPALELPKLIPTFKTGFDTVANRISLIVLPILLDLFLWLGPHFGVQQLFLPIIQGLNTIPGLDDPSMAPTVISLQSLWKAAASHFNLASAMRTFPVGITSLMVNRAPMITPLGNPPIIEIPTFLLALVCLATFIMVGLIAGVFYFNQLSRVVFNEKSSISIRFLGWSVLQVLLLSLTFIFLVFILSLPMMVLLPILALINPNIAQFILPFMIIIMVWILVPLLFSPHGIFAFHQNALISMLTSTRLVRASLPASGLFLLAVLVLSQGLDLLWSAPPDSSWLALVGIFGHAFITTSLMAASFVYYRDIMRWAQETLQQQSTSQTPSRV